MAHLAPLKIGDMPKPLPLRKLIGPSFIILGVGLGSGELILWPYLASNFGLGIAWAAVLGITFQFFINMEIQRYTLVTGESIFVGMTRKYGSWTPYWFIVTTLVPWMWPGITAAAAKLIASGLGIPYSGVIGAVLLLLMGGLFSLGKVVYKTQEQIQKAIILIGVPFVFIITLFFAKPTDWQALASGLIGRGEGYNFIPAALPFATFLAAFAYAGAGGNLNLAQSLYAKEKGYGMGKFSGRITNILAGKKEDVVLEGTTFKATKQNVAYFRVWWRRINIEHAIVFWITGAFTMLMLSLLAYSTVFGIKGVETSINFVIVEAGAIGAQTLPALGTFFLCMSAVMLFGTQFSVLGSNARIMSENLVTSSPARFPVSRIPKYFFSFLWLQIIAGVIIFAAGFTEPLTLVVIGAVLNAISMFIYSGLVIWLNSTELKSQMRPGLLRVLIVSFAFVFYGAFSIFTIIKNLPF
ncbi:hypothetical protein A2801_00595 [Candidatus Woesebacteria bacterium RIFCSPHIGHO2_01_FULL_41_10]|uniref:Iron transporter n=1 Tax=Candidatus Woesebacteria bacterium RIFCSPHIGHO2_01_FULL_41_10 TaxID=1802500 RepID=A0A1F7YT28_9BACT|nr:MAG: hypothetical protein A2801_00595 [Candidatus Woesebacteria bacterium RIFCSPHIGHO2_01_FULL_41_10]